MHITTFIYNCLNDEWILAYLIELGVISIPICRKCNNTMTVLSTRRTRYQCNRRLSGIRCGLSKSIFSGSFFDNIKLSLHDMFYALNGWRLNVPSSFISDDLDRNKSIVSKLYRKFNDLVVWDSENRGTERIGGYGSIVEIDECLLVKRKYRRGRILRGQKWVIGGVVRGSINQYFLEFIPHRSRVNLLSVIRRRVAPGSIIMTDEWTGYRRLELYLHEQNYVHQTVNHSLFFVDPITGANTQTVECFWSVMKRILRKKGTNVGNVERRIDLFHVEVFKFRNNKYVMDEILEIMRNFSIFG